jgi:uncharacterized membrane protein YdjX (TVP38/TMEM64 family)
MARASQSQVPAAGGGGFPSYAIQPLIIIVLLLAGFLLHISGLIDTHKFLAVARIYAGQSWLPPVLILVQVVLYTFALPGSTLLWVVAPLYPPLWASMLLTIGGTLGGASAWWFSHRLGEEWAEHGGHGRVYRLLREHNHFLTLFALRVFPGFPHSLINYAAGILRSRLTHFVPATILAMVVKSYLYAVVIHHAATAATVEDLLTFPVYGPLLGLSLLALAGVWIRHKLDSRENPAH